MGVFLVPLNPDDIDSRLHFFLELLSINSNFYLWTYASDGTLMHTNCQDLVLEKFLKMSGYFDYLIAHTEKSMMPLLMSNAMSMVWGAAFEQTEGQLSRIHVLGPVFTHTVTQAELEKQVWGKISPAWKPVYLEIMKKLPVLSTTTFVHRILMMQYCISGEKLKISDIEMQWKKPDQENQRAKSQQDIGVYADRIQVYMAEQSMLQLIRNGDMNFQEVMHRASLFYTGKQQFSTDALQHAKLGQVQFIALCCIAALDGGLSAEVAYNRKDAYIQDVDNAKSITEITEIGKTMYEDYVTLVHRQRKNPSYSKAIQSTCDYIESHLDQNLAVASLANRVGYSEYYLSRLFKKETGFSIDEYARNTKMERAKLLLTSTQDSIQDISDALGFGNRNYFSTTFRKTTGVPPASYRRKYQKL